MKSETTSVLIVGGGIVGLSTYLFLQQQNLNSNNCNGNPVILIERHTGTSIHPRSRGVNTRTMELLRELHLAERFSEAGKDLSLAKGIFEGKTLSECLDAHEGMYTNNRGLGGMVISEQSPCTPARGTQDKVEPVLLAAARERGGDLRFYTELVSFTQNDEGVTAVVRNRETGEESEVHATYLIGADGVKSGVRAMVGIQTDKSGPYGQLLNVLFRADLTQFVQHRLYSLCYIVRPEVVGVFASINNADRTVFHIHYNPSKGESPEDFPAERCKELIRIALGFPEVGDIEILSILPWTSQVSVAQQFQQGRVLIVGDAAHQMPPWGGQGANTGISDAHNLVWKLALVLKGHAHPSLLGTYYTERYPIGKYNSEQSGRQSDERGLIDVHTVMQLLQLPHTLEAMMGFGYYYNSPAVVFDDDVITQTRAVIGPQKLDGSPGTRTPHSWVMHEGRRVSTLDLLGRGCFVLFCGNTAAWKEAAASATSSLGVTINVHTFGEGDLTDAPVADATPAVAQAVVVVPSTWLEKCSLSPNGALLVRPDGFVAWRAKSLAPNPQLILKDVLQKILHRDKIAIR